MRAVQGVSERAQSAPRAASRGRGRVARAVTDAVPEAARRPAEMEQLDSEVRGRALALRTCARLCVCPRTHECTPVRCD